MKRAQLKKTTVTMWGEDTNMDSEEYAVMFMDTETLCLQHKKNEAQSEDKELTSFSDIWKKLL
jgi:hypothetical protein